ncbi:agmatine deiminase family protein [Candidatus Woesearchaeota archaeon]|nr:agmatine deiminase family protein [Candidatus Woesearchaeota archaeon]
MILIKNTPKKLEYRMPAEWERQEAVWISWPYNKETWPNNISEVENSYLKLIKEVHTSEKVNILVNDKKIESRAINKLNSCSIGFSKILFYRIKNVDAWIRDYGPIFLISNKKKLAMLKWNFNAWGNKYEELKADDSVPYKINQKIRIPMFKPDIVFEGGSIDVNGSGLVLTTEQCLLNKNRNPGLNKKEIEYYLKEYLNASKVLWLKKGIKGDDTDGHVDDVARFVNKNTIVCAYEDNKNDENHQILKENYELLKKMTDEDGNKLKIAKIPMPAAVTYNGERLPASYLNFYISNKAVLVPTFKHKNDKKAIKILQKLFPERKIAGINCSVMVRGFGTLHCCTQQQP